MHALQDLFDQLARQHFGDTRTTFAQLSLQVAGDDAQISGAVIDHTAATALITDLRTHAPSVRWQNSTTTLVNGSHYGWAIVQRAAVDVRRRPGDGWDRVTQLAWGEACEVLMIENGWAFVRAADGYLGWTHAGALHPSDAPTTGAWCRDRTHRVVALFAPIFTEPACIPQHQCALLPFGTEVHVVDEAPSALAITTPDGQRRWIVAAHLLPRMDVPQHPHEALHMIEQWLPCLIGVPYLWGGTSSFGYDCSGLTQTLFRMINIALPRDADQQYAAGQPIATDEIAQGDLLFFDTDTALDALPTPPTKVTHVAFALDSAVFMHASRRYGGVGWGSNNPTSPHYLPGYERRLIGVRRYVATTTRARG